jgi:hypothetical protein
MWIQQILIVIFKLYAISNGTGRLISTKECTMKKIVVKKEEQGGRVLFTFRFKALGQLLDEGDPTPLPEKELTDEAEDALAGHLDEYRVGRSSSLVIELPEKELASVSSSLLTEAVRHHFGFRREDVTHDMKIHLREGIYSLILLLGNVAVLLLFVYFASKNEIPLDAISITLIIGFITIMNWVTVWHTYEHFMYDYRNLARKRWIFEKITKIPVTIRGY